MVAHSISLALMKAAFSSEHVPTLIGGVGTHDAALRFVAQCARHTESDSLLEDLVRSALPTGYKGDTVEELARMIRDVRRKQSESEELETGTFSKKKTISEIIIELFDTSGAKLFHDASKTAYMSIPTVAGGALNYGLKSHAGSLHLRHLFYRERQKAPTQRAVEDAQHQLEAQAIYDGPEEKTYLRVGGNETQVYLDLGESSGAAVKIDADGWRVVYDPPVKFIRPSGFGSLPMPAEGKINALRQIISLDDDNWHRLLAFLINCFRPGGPYMCLLIEGAQGSGKSVLSDVIKRIIDPNSIGKMRLAESQHDLMIQAANYMLLVFDNTSGMKADMSDALCSLATGAGMAVRKLYSDQDLSAITAARPFILNGIGDFANRPDLLERSIPLYLPEMAPGQRRTEAEMLSRFNDMHPQILGVLCTAVSCAIRRAPDLPSPTTVRMADAARWIQAAEAALGVPVGALIESIERGQSELITDRISNDSVVVMLHSLLENGAFKGRVSELYDRARMDRDTAYDPSFPQTAAHLSKRLKRLAPAMKKAGINVVFLPRTNTGQPVHIWRDECDPEKLSYAPRRRKF